MKILLKQTILRFTHRFSFGTSGSRHAWNSVTSALAHCSWRSGSSWSPLRSSFSSCPFCTSFTLNSQWTLYMKTCISD